MRSFLICTLMASSAFAHGGQPAAERLFYGPDGLRAIHGNFGLITVVDDALEWSCAETLSRVPFEAFHTADGSWLAASLEGPFESADQGCTWAEVEGPMRGVPVVRFLGSAQGTLALTQRMPNPGQLFVRNESGVFEALGAALPQGALLDLREGHDGRLVALVQDADQDPVAYRADAEVSTWLALASLEGLRSPQFIDLNLGEQRLAIAAIRQASGEIWWVDAAGQTGLRAQMPTPVIQGQSDGEDHWVLSFTGVVLKAVGEGAFLAAEGPEHCLSQSGDGLVGCTDVQSGHLILARQSGGWRPEQPFSALSKAACAPSVCDAPWDLLQALVHPGEPAADAGPGSASAGEGCSCSGTGSFSALMALGLVVLLRRRVVC